MPLAKNLLDRRDATIVQHDLGVRGQALPHRRPRGEDHQVAFMKAGGEAVEVFEAGLDAGNLAFGLVEALDHLERARREL